MKNVMKKVFSLLLVGVVSVSMFGFIAPTRAEAFWGGKTNTYKNGSFINFIYTDFDSEKITVCAQFFNSASESLGVFSKSLCDKEGSLRVDIPDKTKYVKFDVTGSKHYTKYLQILDASKKSTSCFYYNMPFYGFDGVENCTYCRGTLRVINLKDEKVFCSITFMDDDDNMICDPMIMEVLRGKENDRYIPIPRKASKVKVDYNNNHSSIFNIENSQSYMDELYFDETSGADMLAGF